MRPDEWVATSWTTLPNGNLRVGGVHATRGPFQVTVTAEEHATRGIHAAVRAFYDAHPCELGDRR